MELKDLKFDDCFFKVNRIRGMAHFGTYNEYLDKDNATMYSKMSYKQLAEIATRHIKRDVKKLKGGRPGDMAKNFIFSLPPKMESVINRKDKKQMADFVKTITEAFLNSVQANHPEISIKWLREHLTVSLHTDTKHTHFHVLAPTLASNNGLLNNDYTLIDYGKRNISKLSRKAIYNWCRKIIGEQPITPELFMQYAKIESKSKNKAKWKTYKERMKDATIELEEATIEYKRGSAEYEAQSQRLREQYEEIEEKNEKWIRKIFNILAKVERIAEDPKTTYQQIETKFERLETHIEKTEDEKLKETIATEVKKVKAKILHHSPKL
ncbi:hypothetical protein SMGD1_0850 [Sulfurimonas gotlandica GD1]|uniref:Uncharacterized protein n=1 Tax=Sulfurimonas gotlandica (strain DSM 19862 / JCM 16533 / GD1) TaxID=929558 RepID=B6BM46_SULGG|nr:hypothetical protein [Sulfurimonas gotlandica]EDZ61763.1 hypothetical protein CBGD1_1846 [Sulfurimonas gotlandica GD1]EHP29377.1 hypothetical protein SMGD1_0850 [Sulfurimonas gotlandica GD1]